MKKHLKTLTLLIIGLALGLSLSVFAYSYLAQEVGYSPTDTEWDVENTKEALDDLHSLVKCDDSMIGTTWEYGFYAGQNIFVSPCYGNFKLEVWGAQGGEYNATYFGGYGGYSVGQISLKNKDTLYINIGGAGTFRGGTNLTIPGGYNGGGTSTIKYSTTIYAGSGGGATHIATSPGLLSSLETNQSAVIIVAGGGGGAAYFQSSNCGAGGSGGGMAGVSGTSRQGSAVGTGGTQTEPGHTSTASDIGVGSFGQGASSTAIFYAGGGGGWYGGGLPATNANGAGGGSGYIASSYISNKAMCCYRCTESSETNTKTISTTGTSSERDTVNCPNGYSSEPISKCAKSGNGHARITYLGS